MTVLPLHERWGMWDTENVLDVLVQCPGLEFESRTELEVLNGANLLLVGEEIIQFADAEQLGPSKLLRGRRGTEWAIEHAPGRRGGVDAQSRDARPQIQPGRGRARPHLQSGLDRR